jgi:predicted DNA-binding transcriptional regulator YafY
MALNTQIKQILRLTGFIQRKATGTPMSLAQRMNISESTLYAYLKFLREDLDAPIYYDANRQSYCFSREGTFFIGFTEKKL